MKVLWFLALAHAALAQASFGRSYLGNTKLCQKWKCLNSKLGLPDSLPDKNHFQAVLNSVLPEGPWQNVTQKVVDTCYGQRPRIYTSTCPGQGLLFCAVDQLIQNCPEDSTRKDDACAPLTSLAGLRYLFSQSRYKDLEKNLPTERRPEWFLKNYFNSKCCNLPDVFGSDVLNECGFSALITYYDHPAQTAKPMVYTITPPPTTDTNENKLNIVDISAFNVESTSVTTATTKKVKGSEYAGYQSIDPLDCCNMDEFIQPTWRSECDFHLNWSIPTRLVVKEVAKPVTERITTTHKPAVNDVKVVPLSCEQETCVFAKLSVISDSGSVDMDAFSKLLDNVTDFHPDWSKAKARAVTSCLARPIRDYSEECEINKVLACTMDVLSENCPHAKKTDPCKRSKVSQDGLTCQINASKFRPKNRRLFCGIPNLVNHKVLAECGINSISRTEYVPVPETPKKRSWLNISPTCKYSETTKCLLNKMEALNKYGFMDYFKMKDRIRNFTSQNVWAALSDVYLNAFSTQLMYHGHCHTSKKLMNLVDVMLSTCPMSKRKHTHQCNKIFTEMATTAPVIPSNHWHQLPQVWRHFQHVFMPPGQGDFRTFRRNMPTHTTQPTSERSTTKKDSIVDIYQTFLDSNSAPAVQTKAIKPQVISKKPLVLLPVYLRANGVGTGSLSIRPYRDGVMRRDPFELHHKIVAAHTEVNSGVIDPK